MIGRTVTNLVVCMFYSPVFFDKVRLKGDSVKMAAS